MGKGGLGLHTLQELNEILNNNLLEAVSEYYHQISEVCESYSTVYENVDFALRDNAELDLLEVARKKIIYMRQIMTYLSMFMDDLHNGIKVVEGLSISYENEVKYLIELVKKKAAISKDQVYPKFENLSKIYSKFQEQIFILTIRQNVFNNLQNYVKNSSVSIEKDKKLENLIKDVNIKKEEAMFSFESGLYPNGVTILLPHTTADFLDIKLEYQGFCTVTLLRKDGLLVSGKPNIVAKFKDKYMVFYNQNNIQDFLDNPDSYLTDIIVYVKKNSYLINLLNMTEDFPNANLSAIFRDRDMNAFKYKSSAIMVDKDIQTPLHFYENGHIDPNYVWNEWELKKQALQLADIMKKKTVSCQTDLSHFRRENETQVWPMKDKEINTMVNKGTSLPIQKLYVSNLRKYDNQY